MNDFTLPVPAYVCMSESKKHVNLTQTIGIPALGLTSKYEITQYFVEKPQILCLLG